MHSFDTNLVRLLTNKLPIISKNRTKSVKISSAENEYSFVNEF